MACTSSFKQSNKQSALINRYADWKARPACSAEGTEKHCIVRSEGQRGISYYAARSESETGAMNALTNYRVPFCLPPFK